MNFSLGIICLYLLAGCALAKHYDEIEMKKDVPYGSFPAVIPLRSIRTFSMVTVAVIGPCLLLASLTVSLYHGARWPIIWIFGLYVSARLWYVRMKIMRDIWMALETRVVNEEDRYRIMLNFLEALNTTKVKRIKVIITKERENNELE